jgi:hypothetical protein
MKTKDFRIGNLIEADGNVIEIGMIKENFITWNIAKYPENKVWNPFLPINDERLKPISLTEKWLLDFGFKKGADDNYNTLTIPQEMMRETYLFCNYIGSKKYFNSGIAFVDVFDDEVEISMQTDFKYVHQLQNLYHALTGNELKREENKEISVSQLIKSENLYVW